MRTLPGASLSRRRATCAADTYPQLTAYPESRKLGTLSVSGKSRLRGRASEVHTGSFLEEDEHGEPRVVLAAATEFHGPSAELPMNVKDAARFLGVSTQTVYLWVERRRIPHLRVMGRNIRFLKSDLLPFRAQFRQEVENATTE